MNDCEPDWEADLEEAMREYHDAEEQMQHDAEVEEYDRREAFEKARRLSKPLSQKMILLMLLKAFGSFIFFVTVVIVFLTIAPLLIVAFIAPYLPEVVYVQAQTDYNPSMLVFFSVISGICGVMWGMTIAGKNPMKLLDRWFTRQRARRKISQQIRKGIIIK